MQLCWWWILPPWQHSVGNQENLLKLNILLRYWWDRMPLYQEMNRFCLYPLYPLPPPHGQVHHLALLGAHHHPWHPRTAGRHQHLAAGDSWCERKARSSTCASQHRGEERRFSEVGWLHFLFNKIYIFVSARLVQAADLPRYNWTISASGEEITVMADR